MSDVPKDDAGRGPSLTEAEQHVLDVALRAAAANVDGFDDTVLTVIRDALIEVVPFDRLTVLVTDHTRLRYRVLWATAMKPDASPILPIGQFLPHSEALKGLIRSAEPRIVDDVRLRETTYARAALAAGVQSYVAVPIVIEGAVLGLMVVAHDCCGAPSSKALPLLQRLGEVIAAPVARAHVTARSRLLASLVQESPDGMLALDRALVVNEMNSAAERTLGTGRSAILGRDVAELFGRENAALIRAALDSGESGMLPLELPTPSGHVPVDVLVARVSGTTEGSVQMHLRDARPRRAAEEATAQRLEQLAFLRALGQAMAGDLRADTSLSRAVDLCFVRFELGALCGLRVEQDGALRCVAGHGLGAALRRKLDRLSELELEELMGLPAHSGLPEERLIEGRDIRLPDDSPGAPRRWVMLAPLVHARRRLGALLIVGHPGELPKPGERALWESVANTISVGLHAADDYERVVALEAEKRQLVDNLPVVVARVDPETGSTSFVNGAIERVLGVRVAEALGLPGLEGLLADPIEQEASAMARAAAARGERDPGWQDRRYRHADGRVLTLRQCVYPVFDADGAVHAAETIAYDVTTEIESRKQLMQADRLASLGALAAGIAHEINNPVAFIGLAASQVGRLLDRGRDAEADRHLRDIADEVGDAAMRIADIVGELKLFTRMSDEDAATPVDVNRIVQTALTLTSAELRRRARVEVALGELPSAPGAWSRLGQAFVNLLINAAQAIDARGAPERGEAHVVRVSSEVRDGAIVVCVGDTGVGIEARLLPRIFDPFFTTRAAGQGTGLGLAIAYDLVRRAGGDIRVRSERGVGSVFEVILPLSPAAPKEEARSAGRLRAAKALGEPPEVERVEPTPARGAVLIIDDELSLVKALARQLSDRFDVETASTAGEGLARLRARTYDVIVCDLRMPDQSGPAIYEAVHAHAPELAARFIFTTGGGYGASDDELHARASATGRPVLDKPFDGASFERAVAEVALRAS